MIWIDETDNTLKPYLKALIKDTHFNKKAFLLSKNKSTAQLWISLATLYKQLVSLDKKIKLLEETIKENIENKK